MGDVFDEVAPNVKASAPAPQATGDVFDQVASYHATDHPGMPKLKEPEYMNPLPTEHIPVLGAALQPFGEVAAGLRYDPKFREDTTKYGITSAAAAGSAAAIPAAAPIVAKAVTKHPVITNMLATEAISQARKIPVVGKMIPPYAEMLPWLRGGGKEPSGPVEPEPTPEPTPEPIESAPAPKAVPITRQAVGEAVDRSLGVEPIKPGVPIRDQMKPIEGHTPVESSALKSYSYAPEAKELHIANKPGSVYVYGDVSPDQAEAFKNAGSKGKAWAELKNSSSPLVAKIINGKRISVKPSTSEDMTPILQESVAKARAAKAIQ